MARSSAAATRITRGGAGEPVEDHTDLFGVTVQLASRLCSEAEAEGIVVSGLVRDL